MYVLGFFPKIFLLCINNQNLGKSQTLPPERPVSHKKKYRPHEGQKSSCLRKKPPWDEPLQPSGMRKPSAQSSCFFLFLPSHSSLSLLWESCKTNVLCLHPRFPWGSLWSQSFGTSPIWSLLCLIYSVPLFAFTASKGLMVFWFGYPTSNTDGYDIISRIAGFSLFPHFGLNIENITSFFTAF